MWFPKTTLSWTNFTIDDFHLLLAQNIHIGFQLQGNLNNAWHLSAIGTWGAILESILKTRFRTAETFSRTAMGRGSKTGMGRGKGGGMGKGKGAGNPEARQARRNERLEIRWVFKRSSLQSTVGF